MVSFLTGALKWVVTRHLSAWVSKASVSFSSGFWPA